MREPLGRGFKHRSLLQLHERARALPGERRDLCRVVNLAPAADGPLPLLDRARLLLLRRRTAALFRTLAKQVDEELMRALSAGQTRWDQVDALALIPSHVRLTRTALETDWHAAGAVDPVLHAASTEALATIATAMDLLQLVERRLATFVRLRLKQDDPRLMPDGRPFLDIGRALLDTAEAYS
jgi:hypothetical protein